MIYQIYDFQAFFTYHAYMSKVRLNSSLLHHLCDVHIKSGALQLYAFWDTDENIQKI